MESIKTMWLNQSERLRIEQNSDFRIGLKCVVHHIGIKRNYLH